MSQLGRLYLSGFVDMIAEAFADELPTAWGTQTIRDRVTHVEYESAIDPARLFLSSASSKPGKNMLQRSVLRKKSS